MENYNTGYIAFVTYPIDFLSKYSIKIMAEFQYFFDEKIFKIRQLQNKTVPREDSSKIRQFQEKTAPAWSNVFYSCRA